MVVQISTNDLSTRTRTRYIVAAIAIVIAAIWAGIALIRMTSTSIDSEKSILKQFESGQLAATEVWLELPPDLRHITCDGRVYVTRCADGQDCLVFPKWRGKGGNFRGLMYCPAPHRAGEQLLLNLSTAPPVADRIAKTIKPVYTSRLEADVESNVDANWYEISRTLD